MSPCVQTPVQVRLATTAEMPAIIPVVNAAFAIQTFFEGTRTDEGRMAEMMRKGKFLVAQDGSGKIVATVFTELRGGRGYFGMLAVDPTRQGTGLGRRMVEAAENHCRRHGCSHVDIVILSRCPELLPFYGTLGYVETGTEEFHSSRPLKGGLECHCIILSKAL